jgi:hypothetical protein
VIAAVKTGFGCGVVHGKIVGWKEVGNAWADSALLAVVARTYSVDG